MKIAILGAGAMGSLVGAYLKKGGQDVTLIDPYLEHMRVIRDTGLHMVINGNEEVVQMKTFGDASQAGVFDAVICLVKGMYTEAALQAASSLFDKNTYVVTPQNGLGNAAVLERIFPKHRILQGVMKITSQLEGPGRIKSNVLPNLTAIHIGTVCNDDNAAKAAKALADAWVTGGLKAEYHEHIEDFIWGKAINNIAINAACAIVRTNIGDYCTHPYGRDLLERCLKEIILVAAAKGVALDYETVMHSIEENTIPKFGAHYPSTAQDVRAKKPTEIDSLNGAISRYGKEHGIPTPVNDAITAFVHVIQDNYDNMF